ncbi:MAG: CGNR zinc finger domain-containing protein [Solirubrobacteraceae bacterium]|mgnify:CR=1 FL=1|nr:CGNR zinc finger domain-containing protein [Solirubrobacteraceae bacterium]
MDLPDDLDLPLERGEPYWYWLGGRPALDFVNTLRERWWRRVETLVTPGDLARWLVAAGVADAPPPAGPADVERARALREAIDAAVVETVAGRDVPAACAEAIDGALRRAPLREAVALEPSGALALTTGRDGPPVDRALAAVAADAAAMLGAAERGRVRICASETCSARFFDRSPAGARRWCSMRLCGNVAKARRHRRRHRAAAGRTPSDPRSST